MKKNSDFLQLPAGTQDSQELINAAKAFLQEIDLYLISKYQEGETVRLSARQAYQFFRSYERNENLRNIISYLLKFIENPPLALPDQFDIVDPLIQFREFVHFQVSLLLQEDVREAIIREHKAKGYLTSANEWYYLSKIDEKYEVLMGLIAHHDFGSTQRIEVLKNCLTALKELARSWFEIRNYKERKIRRADIYIFKLSSLLEQLLNL